MPKKKFIPKYFKFEAIVNGIGFLISFSDFIVYRQATDFCVLILYPATLMNVFIRTESLLVEFLGSFRYKIIFTNRDNFTSTFPN
jgi:hypothetical protein